MPTTLANAAAATDMTADGIAALTGQANDVVSGWFDVGIVPSEHRNTVAAAIGVDPSDLGGNGNAPAAKPAAKNASKKPSRRKSVDRGVAAEVSNAIRLCVEVATMPSETRTLLEQVGQIDVDDTAPADQLYATVVRLLSLPKPTADALATLDALLQITNPIKVGAELGAKGRRELVEIHRVALALSGRSAAELPSSDDALLDVAEAVGELDDDATRMLSWLRAAA